MNKVATNTLKELQNEVKTLLKSKNLNWDSIETYETSDGYLVLIRTKSVKEPQATEISLELEEILKDPLVSISIIPVED
jgi:crotonobetainyl-CoA:carnitine CoA-transferase CaiB-like acyl-CoA transferase